MNRVLPADQTADLLLLRKTPYLDNGVIFQGVSPILGRMGFFYRLPSTFARQHRKGTAGIPDLFQIVQIEYRQNARDDELVNCRRAVVSADYTGVANTVEGYDAACFLARFALANLLPQVPMPNFFQALQVALIRLQSPARIAPNAVLTGMGLAFLNEAGWLSAVPLSPHDAAQCQLLLKMAAGGDIPALDPEVWAELWNWTRSRLLDAECQLPEESGR